MNIDTDSNWLSKIRSRVPLHGTILNYVLLSSSLNFRAKYFGSFRERIWTIKMSVWKWVLELANSSRTSISLNEFQSTHICLEIPVSRYSLRNPRFLFWLSIVNYTRKMAEIRKARRLLIFQKFFEDSAGDCWTFLSDFTKRCT